MARDGLPADVACRVLGVSVSGFYAQHNRPPSPRAIRHAFLTDLIRQIHRDSHGTYGARRIHAELTLGHQLAVGHSAVEMLMRRAGIAGIGGRPRFRRIANIATAHDLVERQFARHDPDQLWVTDITEHPTREGKLYCAVVLGCLLAARGRVVNRRITDRSADHECPRHGDRWASAQGHRDSFRSGGAIYLVGVYPPGNRLRACAINGIAGRLL